MAHRSWSLVLAANSDVDVRVDQREAWLAQIDLLTHARQGMVIFVPRGDPSDPTRSPELYDDTFEYLTSVGLEVID